MPSFSKPLTVAYLAICLIALLLSLAGAITSFLALRNGARRDNGFLRLSITFADLPYLGNGRSGGTGWYYSDLPRVLHYGNEQAVAGASITILILSFWVLIMHSINSRTDMNKRKTMFSNRISIVTVNSICSLLCVLAAIIALIYNMAANPSSEVQIPDQEIPPPESFGYDLDRATIGYNGTFNLRGWSCGIYDFASILHTSSARRLRQTCTLTNVARWIMVPLVVAALGMLLCSVLLARKAKSTQNEDQAVNLDDRKQSAEVSE